MTRIKGVILAGGQGTRLRPFTHLINKHLLPVYDKPLIYYPLLAMKHSGISEILLTSNREDLSSFKKLLGNGSEFNLQIEYAPQDGPRGIAHALGLAEKFADGSKIAVMLGDNIFIDYEQIKHGITKFLHEKGAKLFLKEVPDPERFGIAQVEQAKIISIIEKPERPLSNFAVTGLYLYDSDVFQIVKTLTPSKRGELEITDVNNYYVEKGLAKYEVIEGEWIDAGTFDSLLHASVLMLKKNKEFPIELA